MRTDTAEIIARLKGSAFSKGVPGDGPIGIKGVLPEFKAVSEPQSGRDDYLAIANTDDIDLDDEVVIPSGLSTTYIARNKQLFADHSYGTMDVVGSIRYFKKYPSPQEHTAWQVRISLNESPLGLATRAIIENTGHTGLSIGFRAIDYGPPSEDETKRYTRDSKRPRSIVRSGEWFELSTTPLPCNVSCQTGVAIPSGEKRVTDLVDLVRKGIIDRECAAMLGIPVEARRKFHAAGWVTDMDTGIQVPA
jgi:hypothetical protein